LATLLFLEEIGHLSMNFTGLPFNGADSVDNKIFCGWIDC
jgi:hypothetical protein